MVVEPPSPWHYDDGSSEEYTYTNDNLLSTLNNKKADQTIIDSYTYTYDAAHNMLSKLDAKGTTSYTYDVLNRLLTVTEPSGRLTTYAFDASGNRLTETVVLGTSTTITTYTYDDQNRLTNTLAKLNNVNKLGVAYTYDNNGNQLVTTKTDYISGVPQTPVVVATNTYDTLNQLTSTATNGDTITNTYNGDGLRVEKTVNNDMTRYLYEYDKVVLEQDGLNNQTAWNVYGSNLISRKVGTDTLTYMYNGHADVTALLDTSGNLVATYYYDAFGNILEKTGTVDSNILYGGYQYDKETGLYYLNARMYDPITARFLQKDTYRGEYNDPLSLNLYTYCHNEPLMYSDPTGHWAVWDAIKNGASKAASSVINLVSSAAQSVNNFVSNIGKTKTKVVSAGSSKGKASNQAMKDAAKSAKIKKYTNDVEANRVQSITKSFANKVERQRVSANIEGMSEQYKILATHTGDDNVDIAYTNWWDARLQFDSINDPSYTASSIAAFQNRLLYLSKNGTDLSNLSVYELNSLFQCELNDQSTLTMAMSGAALVVLSKPATVAGSAVKTVKESAAKGASKTGEWHHIASDKSIKSGFTEAYKKIFNKAGMSLKDDLNKVLLEGHSGVHTKIYKQYVLDYIKQATEGLSGSAAKDALTRSLKDLADQLIKNPKMPCKGGL